MDFSPLTSAIQDNDIQWVKTFMSIAKHNAKRLNVDHGAALLPHLCDAAHAHRLEIVSLMLPLCSKNAQQYWPSPSAADTPGVSFIHWWLSAPPQDDESFQSIHARWQSQYLHEHVDQHSQGRVMNSKSPSKI